MTAYRRLGACLALAALTASAASGQSKPSGFNGGPPGPPGPPGLHPPLAGDRPFLPPLRGRGRAGSVGDLMGMMDAMGADDAIAIIDEPVTSFGNENFWLSEMELSARAVVGPAAPVGERLAGRR